MFGLRWLLPIDLRHDALCLFLKLLLEGCADWQVLIMLVLGMGGQVQQLLQHIYYLLHSNRTYQRNITQRGPSFVDQYIGLPWDSLNSFSRSITSLSSIT